MKEEKQSISIIIPVTRDEPSLHTLIKSISKEYEVIIVGFTDNLKIIRGNIVIIKSDVKCRSLLMNMGAAAARGKILLFLHADTLIAQETLKGIANIGSIYVGGAVAIKFNPNRLLLTLIAWGSNNIRMKLFKRPYGDQCIFVRKKVFEELRGYKSMALFEDSEFSKRLNKKGKLLFLKGAITSSRRFITKGTAHQMFLNWYLTTLYMLGVSDKKLRELYEQ